MKKTTAFQTTDGKLFIDELEAINNQIQINLKHELIAFSKSNNCSSVEEIIDSISKRPNFIIRLSETAESTKNFKDTIKKLLSQGKRVKAIKQVKTAFGLNLKDAKDYIDSFRVKKS